MTQLCKPTEEFQPEDCEKNGIMVEAGKNCYGRVKSEANKVKAKLEALHAAYAKGLEQKGMSAQDIHFNTSEYAYQNSQWAADYLMQVTNMAYKEVLDYRDNLWPPEDYDSAWITQGDQARYLMTTPCYGQNKLGLDQILAALDQEKNNIAAQKAASAKKEGSSGAHKGDLTTVNKGVAQTSGKGGAVPVKKGSSAKGSSDISGTKKAIDDASKSKTVIQQQK
ncbi:MAG TPA: hypothetical protein VIH99_04280 [Bdellovibrionota bacterium]